MTSLLDTNVISQRIKPLPHEGVMRWLSQLAAQDAFLSVVTIQEIRTGIELLSAGQKRRNLELWLGRDIRRGYAGRILPITEEIADRCGRLVAQIRRDAKTPTTNDMLIAATAQVHGLQLATMDWDHFEGLNLQLVKFLGLRQMRRPVKQLDTPAN